MPVYIMFYVPFFVDLAGIFDVECPVIPPRPHDNLIMTGR